MRRPRGTSRGQIVSSYAAWARLGASRPRSGGVQQAYISYRAGVQCPDEAEEIVEVEVLDLGHTVPRRWSTSPHL